MRYFILIPVFKILFKWCHMADPSPKGILSPRCKQGLSISSMSVKLLEISQDMACVINEDGYFVFANNVWVRTLGWTLEELYARHYLDLIHPDDVKSTLIHADLAAKGEDIIKFENRYRCKDGKYIWLEWNTKTCKQERQIYAKVRNVTEEKRQYLHAQAVEKITKVGSWEINLVDQTLYWSRMTHQIHGTDHETYVPKLEDSLSFYPPEVLPELQMWIDRLMVSGEGYDLELPFVTITNRRIWVRATASAEKREGKIVRVFGTFQDITLRKKSEAEIHTKELHLREAEALLRDVLDTIPDAVAAFSSDGRLLIYNEAYKEFYAISAPAIKVGAQFGDILRFGLARGQYPDAGTTPREWNEWLQKRLELHRTGKNKVVQKLNDGRWLQIHEQRSSTGIIVGVRTDITNIKEAEAKIKRQSHEDSLTGLANRMSLHQEVLHSFQHTRDGTLHEFSVMLIDLDRFKAVNDTFGHATGDKLLVEVADRMRNSIRKGDIVARLGGDEFAVLYRVAPNQRNDSVAIASRLVDKISSPYEIDGRQIIIGASIGVALAPEHGKTIDELFRNADTALYHVKENGKNNFFIFDEAMDSNKRDLRALEADLRLALQRQEFQLVYQPILSLRNNRVESVEALIRWHHPTRGLVPPDTFIGLAEETGLITQIGEWVIHKACEDALQFPETVSVAINVSAVQLRNRSLLDVIEAALWKTQLSPKRIEIEVTETVLLDINKILLPDLQRLQEMGVRIVLDDFGTGYSSLSYLRLFSFDKIKIDRTFVSDIGKSGERNAIVTSIIGLARNLDITCIAEGIETEEQIITLRAAGCDMAQGYFYSRPLMLSQFIKWHIDKEKGQNVARLMA
jgi:diguanylate cyclase (GGDEF)-like protein/PAS domain S-box-containing protein